LGKARVYELLKPWCEERGLKCPSVSAIGRIIARAADKMRYVSQRLDARGRPKPVKRKKRLRKPRRLKVSALKFWTVDLIERVRDGIWRYILTMVDPVSRVAFAVAIPSKRAKYTAEGLRALVEGNGRIRVYFRTMVRNLRESLRNCWRRGVSGIIGLSEVTKDECSQ